MSEFVWGIDPAVSHISFACADLDSDHMEVESLITRTEEREGARLGLLDRRIRSYGKQLAGLYPPACIWIEQPSGRYIKPQSYYVVGVLQAALFETLACPVWTIPPLSWKKRAVGFGNASKAQVQAWCERQRFDFQDEHEADAVAIAHAGRLMFESRQWEKAA